MAPKPSQHQEIEGRVIRVIAETQQIGLGTITSGSTFEDLGINSFDAINILFALETEFNVSVPDEKAEGLRSVAEVIRGIEDLLAQPPARKPG